ncbi:glycosyltransferase [Parafrankia sp. EUN1f]|uniref:glycosyltransferase n=1 Tax=Parafrankia sp. EUN1f TaxID=102897 RepID=UPI0001C44D7F|nr:glycosyltransferase [Parafrankia sp. EUN1f]EFC85427.1 glycosyl transferase group 1 [Parafrankia sp. EUN1f]
MRIVQAASFVAPASGGIRTTLRHLATGYTAAGHEVVQIVPGAADNEERTPHARIITLRAPFLPRTGYRILADPRRVAAVAEQVGADRIEIHDRATLRPLGRWARKAGVRSLVVSHERLDRLLSLWTPAPLRGVLPVSSAADHSNRALAAAFDTVVATTRWAATEFVRIGAENLVQVPLGVELERFTPANHDRTLRRAFARDREILIVAATRLSPEKRVDIALSAVAELVRRAVPVRLVIAGDGSSRGRLERMATGLPVTFLGFVADPARLAGLLATADLAFAPGPIETFGLAALEAMASGTAPVVNHSSALAEMVAGTGDGQVAGLSAAGTGFTFADAAMELLALDPDHRRAAARSRAEQFPWEATITGFLRCHDAEAPAPPASEPAPTRDPLAA